MERRGSAAAAAAIAAMCMAGAIGEASAQDAPPAAAPAASDPPPPRPRSVLFYLVDTCRGDRMGFNGYRRMTTPFLSRLAERSVVFENCSSQAPWTKPSMASMLCSQYPSTTGVYEMLQRLPDEAVTWPEVLNENGWYAAAFSTNIVMSNLMSNYGQGFDRFVESTLINRGDPIRFASGSAKKLNQHAFTWLDRTDYWPMLLYLHSVDPHEEYAPEPQYLEQFADPRRDPAFREEWKRLLATRPGIPGLHVTQDNFDRAKVDAPTFLEHASDLYDADILANDHELQRLWDKLAEDGWGEDFVFVFTSDHGEEFFEHGATSHGYSLYDEMTRVPLMIHAPGLLPEGLRITRPVRSLDIFPTLCDLLGLAIPESVQGRSLLPLIREPGSWQDLPVVSEHREDPGARYFGQASGEMVAIREWPWKFILNQRSPQQIERPRFELYDLESDPEEQVNVADDHPEIVRGFELKVATFIGDHREGAAVEEWVTPDPETLEQLRKLGYISTEGGKERPDLWAAARSGDLAALRAHLAEGAEPDQQESRLGVTPLSFAAMFGQEKAAQLLLAKGAAVDARNRDGATPLHGAAFLGRAPLVAILLEKEADAGAKNAVGQTPLEVTAVDLPTTRFIAGLLELELDEKALAAGREECARLLREHAAKTPSRGG